MLKHKLKVQNTFQTGSYAAVMNLDIIMSSILKENIMSLYMICQTPAQVTHLAWP